MLLISKWIGFDYLQMLSHFKKPQTQTLFIERAIALMEQEADQIRLRKL